jgi:hypothetical protein
VKFRTRHTVAMFFLDPHGRHVARGQSTGLLARFAIELIELVLHSPNDVLEKADAKAFSSCGLLNKLHRKLLNCAIISKHPSASYC